MRFGQPGRNTTGLWETPPPATPADRPTQVKIGSRATSPRAFFHLLP